MAKDTATAKNKNRRIRQEALREQLANQGHLQHVTEILDRLQDEAQEIEPAMVNRYKTVVDAKIKLMSKYIPDLKSTELTGEGGDPIEMDMIWKIEVPD